MIKKYTKEIDGHNVSISCDDSVERQGQALFQILEQQNKLTPLFHETCTIRIGWSYYYIRKPENGNDYQVVCPDFNKDPIKEKTKDLTTAIIVQDMLIDTLVKTKQESMQDIFFADTVTVSQAVMPGREICMQRMETKKSGDSGWTIVVENPTKEDKEKPMVNVLVCNILKLNPALMGLLALPAGSRVVTSDGQKKFRISMEK